MTELVDLRSDTVTRPTAAMRHAISAAEVGDDVYGEDPSVRDLEVAVADRFGREAAVFVPSGIMATQILLRALTRPGTELVCESNAHVVAYEVGAAAINAQVQTRTVDGDRGRLDADRVLAALRPDAFPYTEGSGDIRGGDHQPRRRGRARPGTAAGVARGGRRAWARVARGRRPVVQRAGGHR